IGGQVAGLDAEGPKERQPTAENRSVGLRRRTHPASPPRDYKGAAQCIHGCVIPCRVSFFSSSPLLGSFLQAAVARTSPRAHRALPIPGLASSGWAAATG